MRMAGRRMHGKFYSAPLMLGKAKVPQLARGHTSCNLSQVNWTALWAHGWQQQFTRALLCAIPIGFIMCACPDARLRCPFEHELR